MYDFKQYNNDNQRYNSYKSYPDINDVLENSFTLEKRVLFIFILVMVFLSGIFSLTLYQKYFDANSKTTISKKIKKDIQVSNSQLTQAITKSIAQNLQSKQLITSINDDELKRIIKRVVKKIEQEPKKIIYSKN